MLDGHVLFNNTITLFEKNTDLNGVASFWRRPLKADNDLKLLCLEVFWREVVERGRAVDLVSNHQGEEELEVLALLILHRGTKLEGLQVVGHHLAFLSGVLGKEVARDVALNQVARSQVRQPHQQVEASVPQGDEGVLAEHDRLPPVAGLRELGKDDPGHASLDDDPKDALEAHHDDRHGTLLRCRSPPVTYRVLGLQTEEEAGGEVLDVVHTHNVLLRLVLHQVSMDKGHQVPDHCEDQPGQEEGGGEAHEDHGPGQVDGRREEVLQESVVLLSIVPCKDKIYISRQQSSTWCRR